MLGLDCRNKECNEYDIQQDNRCRVYINIGRCEDSLPVSRGKDNEVKTDE